MSTLIPMDRRVLAFLVENGPTDYRAIPLRLFAGKIPSDLPSLPALGYINDQGNIISITDAGRVALAAEVAS